MVWGVGLRRREIEEDTVEAIHRITFDYANPNTPGGLGLPVGNVFWADQSSGNAPTRPYVSITLSSPVSQGPRGRLTSAEIRRYMVTEEWRVVVTDNADDTYTIQIKGVDYSFPAVSQSIEQIRDGLIAALAAQTEATTTTIGTDTVVLTSVAVGDRLKVVTSPASLTARQTRQQILSRMTWSVNCLMKIRCFGFFDTQNPQPEDSGEHLAEIIAMGLMHSDIMITMRSHCHIFRKVQTMPQMGGVFEQEVRSMGAINIILNTEGRQDATLPSTTRVTGNVNTFSLFDVQAPTPVPPP